MLNKNTTSFLLVLLLSLFTASQAFYKEGKNQIEREPASAEELKALLEGRRLELNLDADGITTNDQKMTTTRSGHTKVDGDEIEISFMITMEEFRDTITGDVETIGDKFVFSGPMAVANDDNGTWTSGDDEIGVATGSCVVCMAEPQWCCDFFFTFDKNGGDFYQSATVASSGYVFEEAGRFWVTGSGGDFVMSHNGMGEMLLDPFFNPVFYFKLNLRA